MNKNNEDIWAVEYSHDYGAEMPLLTHPELAIKGLKAFVESGVEEAQAHRRHIVFYWTKNGHVTDSERQSFREQLTKEKDKYPNNQSVQDLFNELTPIK